MEQASRYIKINSKVKYYIFVLIRFLLLPFARLIYGSKKIWIICERGDDAQDNGYLFFEYLVNNKKNIKPIFLIKKQSPDYKKVSSIGKVIAFGSVRHFLLCIGSRVKLSSNLYGYAPWIVMEKYYRRNISSDIHVFLQHGITKNYHESFLAKYNKSLSLFITGSRLEYEHVCKEYGYDKGIVFYSGLPRFDKLFRVGETKNQLLIMPTWRSYLKGISLDEFKSSVFYCHWMSLLNSSVLSNLCKNNNLVIKFYLHHELQKYSECFKDLKNVKLVSYGESTVQQLLIDSKILITDYSSVFFDFAYLNKPIIFYQFDEEEYYSKHYEKGYFDYRKSNLGDVCTKEEVVLTKVDEIIASHYRINDHRKKSIDIFYTYHDDKNCERIYNKICELITKNKLN